jgi:hypothetical protein
VSLLRLGFAALNRCGVRATLEGIDTEVSRQFREFGENGEQVEELLLVFF